MKKIICIFGALVILLGLSGCSNVDIQEVPNETRGTSMFIEVEVADIWRVVYHKDTKVMYVVSYGSYNSGTFTLLVDDEGNPLLYEQSKVP